MLRTFFILLTITFSLQQILCDTTTTTDNPYIMKIRPVKRNKYKRLAKSEKLLNESETDSDLEKKMFIPPDLETISLIIESFEENQCGNEARIVLDSIKRRERWAMQLLDASAKFPEGVLYGAYYQLGNFDECIAVEQPELQHITHKLKTIKGKYCLADVSFESNKNEDGRVARSYKTEKKPHRGTFNNTLYWAICIPSSCTNKDAELFLSAVFEFSVLHKKVVVNISDDKCHFNNDVPLTSSEILYGCILGLFLIFLTLATGYHFMHIKSRKETIPYSAENPRPAEPSVLHSVIICFSVIQNVKKFLHTQSNELNLECISGIKFLSMGFIIVGHALIFLVSSPVQNIVFFDQAMVSLRNGFFLNNPLLVDTFLLISGFLMCRLLLIELEKRKGKINFFIVYIARYIRLTPSYIVVIGFYSTFFMRMDSGPLWDSQIAIEQERCIKSWWTNILYINNYVNTEHLCMFQSWYLAVDTQLFIIAPAIIYPLWRWRKYGLSVLGGCIGISVIIPTVITYIYKLDPTFMPYAPEISDLAKNYYFTNFYIKTHMRATSYCLGILFGYIVHKLQSSGIKISPHFITIGWIVSAICGIVSMFSVTIFYLPEHEYDTIESALYSSLHRVAWCLSIGWVLVACITENAAMINKLLSWKFFVPLCRLTYSAYLANGIIVLHSRAITRSPIYLSYYSLGSLALSHLVLTFGLAFIICICFESPIHGLEKILLRSGKARNKRINSAQEER